MLIIYIYIYYIYILYVYIIYIIIEHFEFGVEDVLEGYCFRYAMVGAAAVLGGASLLQCR